MTPSQAPARALTPATGSHRERIIAAAIVMTEAEGWESITMTRLADHVGVSRQTVYNEIGTKPDLAEAMVLDELSRFLLIVGMAFDRHPDDAVDAVRDAVRGVLEMARDHPLIAAIVASSHGADRDLLPLLTTRSESVLTLGKSAVAALLEPHTPFMNRRLLEAAVDVIVRTVLSHVMQPSASPKKTSDDMAWIAGRLLTEAR